MKVKAVDGNSSYATLHNELVPGRWSAYTPPELVKPPIAPHPQRDGREAEEKGQDRQEGEESAAKDCEGLLSIKGSHEMEIVTKGVEQSSDARARVDGRIPGSDRAWRGDRSHSAGRGRCDDGDASGGCREDGSRGGSRRAELGTSQGNIERVRSRRQNLGLRRGS
jgi:hypothetical protein